MGTEHLVKIDTSGAFRLILICLEDVSQLFTNGMLHVIWYTVFFLHWELKQRTTSEGVVHNFGEKLECEMLMLKLIDLSEYLGIPTAPENSEVLCYGLRHWLSIKKYFHSHEYSYWDDRKPSLCFVSLKSH